jgi:hypothetical protein
MYFAVQAWLQSFQQRLLMYQIQKSGKKISMLVANNKGVLLKATGRITFV